MLKTLLVVSLASAPMAGGLIPFSAGSPAKADEVNRNFNYLDSAKAEKATVDLLTSAINSKAEKSSLESLTKALDGKTDSTVWKALRDSSGNLRSAIQKLPTSSVDTTAKRRIDSLAAATKIGDAGLSTRVSTVETNLANKVDKGTITAASIGALPVSDASHKGTLTTDGLFSKEGVRITGLLEAGGGLRILPKQEIKFGMEYDPKQEINTTVLASALADNAYLSGAKIDDFIIRHKLDESRILLGVGADNPLPGIEISVKAVKVNLPLQVKSTEPWADYVFEPGYKAMPLKEIEAFAKSNGHLPEVPTAAEVQKDGIDLAKMNAILLKKIEELTLHAIEQEKKMEALNTKLESMEARQK